QGQPVARRARAILTACREPSKRRRALLPNSPAGNCPQSANVCARPANSFRPSGQADDGLDWEYTERALPSAAEAGRSPVRISWRNRGAIAREPLDKQRVLNTARTVLDRLRATRPLQVAFSEDRPAELTGGRQSAGGGIALKGPDAKPSSATSRKPW